VQSRLQLVTHEYDGISLVRIVSVLLRCGFYFIIQRPLSCSPTAARHFASLGQEAPLGAGYFCAPDLFLAKPGFGGLKNTNSRAKPPRLPLRPGRESHAPSQTATREQAAPGRNTGTNGTSDHQGGKPVELLKFSDLGMHLKRPNGMYFK
jgi:hypothetical protein